MTPDAAQVTRRLVRGLTAWGSASVALGGILALTGRSSAARTFGQQSAMWGAVDLGLAALAAPTRRPVAARVLRRILLVNVALDVGYVAAGGHLAARTPSLGGRLTRDQARGHGLAVVIQGIALFVIDLTNARRLRR
ncbi:MULTISPECIES: DUF6992 family protein [unclassified Microbacterium]|uniref:DUF6992 family protein n=1 Tax=unclassified Microbacterium TaxID=2609290 RepID=UPI00386FEB87